MNKTLTISLKEARKLYSNGGEDIKNLLLNSFTIEELVSFTPKEWNNYVKVSMDGKIFFISKYLVTQKDWYNIMGTNPSHFEGNNKPVENVSYNDIVIFIKKLNIFIDKEQYRLPTEEEWQYCAECGSGIKYTANEENAIFDIYNTENVGQKKPNDWGLYDMLGNVWEWTDSWYDSSNRVIRGGSWCNNAENCRSAIRNSNSPDYRSSNFGFRLIMNPYS